MNDCTSNRGLEMYYSAITGTTSMQLKKAYGIFRESGNTTMKLKAKTLREKYDKSEQNMKMNINYQEDI